MAAATPRAIAVVGDIRQRIHEVRGQRVMLDEELARLYGVTTKRLNEQVRRNRARFPADFMFKPSVAELAYLRSQFATSSAWGGRRHAPFAFTEHGAVMLATVLKSQRAVEMSLLVVRAFVQMRQVVTTRRALARKLSELERRLGQHDQKIADLMRAIRALMVPPPDGGRRRTIGF